MVKDLIENERWKESLVRQHFPHHLVDEILVVPIASTHHEDYRFWTYDPKEKYTVRDEYKVATGFYDSPVSSSSSRLKSWWQYLWAFSIPPKVRIFCWRVMHDIISTEQNLLSYHVPVSGMYPLCQSVCDSTSHALFACPTIKICWKETCFWPLLKQVRQLAIVDIFLWMKEKLGKTEFEVFAMRTWAIWFEQLSAIHKKKKRAKGINAEWSEIILHDFQHAKLALSSTTKKNKCNSPDAWVIPPEGKLRLDVDAAYNEESDSYAIAGVVRNHEGQPVLAFGKKLDKPQSITCAKLLAIEGGLKIAQKKNLLIYQVTSDSLLAVQAVTRLKENLSYVGSIATDIRIILDFQSNITLSHVRRSVNVVAHLIAVFTISSSPHFVWETGIFFYGWFIL